jgi:hypothetical protein
MLLVCDRCGARLQPVELRRESLEVFGRELVEVRERDRVGYACPRCAEAHTIGVMQTSRPQLR